MCLSPVTCPPEPSPAATRKSPSRFGGGVGPGIRGGHVVKWGRAVSGLRDARRPGRATGGAAPREGGAAMGGECSTGHGFVAARLDAVAGIHRDDQHRVADEARRGRDLGGAARVVGARARGVLGGRDRAAGHAFSEAVTSAWRISPAEWRRRIWLPGARMNIVESCFHGPADAPAIVHQAEGGRKCRRLTRRRAGGAGRTASPAGLVAWGFGPATRWRSSCR